MGGKKVNTEASKDWQTGTQSGATGLDPQTEAWIKQIYGAAQAAGNAQPSSVTQGMAALTGDSAAAQRFMNPYNSQVIDAMTKQFGVNNQMGMNAVNDAATRAGAFGGSRHGVATGTMLAENARNQNAQIAGLLNTGFEGAMNRAGQAVNLGMGGAGSPEAWRLLMLKQGFQGLPYGQTYRGTSGMTRTHTGYGGQSTFGIG